MRAAFEIAYHGAPFHGWQRQPNALGVQQVIEEALSTLFRQPIDILGCGRTDTGVHASQYFFHADLPDKAVDFKALSYRLNALLPNEIAVIHAFETLPEFHARFDALSRSYVYQINLRKDPFLQGLSWYFARKLDIEAMQKGSAILLQYTEFGAFCKTHADNKTNRCVLTEASWKQSDHVLRFHITADRFLRNMVRAIVGTLIEVGTLKLQPEQMHEVILSGNRSEAGMSVPACGLFLEKVQYNWDKWKK